MNNIINLEFRLNRYYRALITKCFYRPFMKKCGRRCIIYKPNIFLGIENLILNDNVMIYKNARIEIVSSYAGKKYTPTMKVGKGSQIHQNCHITCGNEINIGDNVMIISNVTITDIIHPYDDITVPSAQQPIKVGKVSIGDCSYIYNNVVICPNVDIGKSCIVGANSVVKNNIPDYCMAVGAPAKIIKKYNFMTKKWESV